MSIIPSLQMLESTGIKGIHVHNT